VISFAADVLTIHITHELREVLKHVQLWSTAARLEVQISTRAGKDAPGWIGGLSGRSFALLVAVAGDRRQDTAQLGDHMRAALPVTYGVCFRGDAVEVNWDARRRAQPESALRREGERLVGEDAEHDVERRDGTDDDR
jgi:hypothetical protein